LETFRQALELDAHVRKGERGSTVVYASTVTRTGTDAKTGEETQENIPFLKSYTVFNVEQIEGLPPHFHAIAEPRLDPVQRIERAESFFAATRADIRHGGNMAYYNIGSDFVL
jgi:antirestriction protein ArdC